MLAAAKEETFSALSGPGVLFPLAACEGVGKKPRQGFGRKNVALHRGSALPNSRTALRDRGSLARNSRRMSLLPQAQAPAQTCTGFGRGLGNTGALAGNQGGIPGVTVELGTAAVIPSQFGVPTGAALGPYAPNISGIIGTASFSSVSDVIGGKSPIPGVNVRTALQQLFPGQLILEIYGAGDQGANAPVSINVPAGLGCPAGTSPAVLGDPVLPSPGSPIPAVARRIRW